MAIGSIQEQITVLEEKKAGYDSFNPMDQFYIAQLDQQIEELRKQENREQSQEQRINGEITFNVDGVDMTKLPAEVIKLINLVVKHDRKQIYAEQNTEFANLLATHRKELEKSEEESQNWQRQCREQMEQIATMQDEYEKLNTLYQETTVKCKEFKESRDDFEQKLKNATDIIEEKDQEIQRLNRVISDNAAAQHFGEKKSQEIIDITPDPTDDVQNLVNTIAAQFEGLEELKKNTDDYGTLIKVNKPDGGFEVMKRDQYEKLIEKVESPVTEVQPLGESFCVEIPTAEFGNSGIPNAEAPVEVNSFRTTEAETVLPVCEPSDIGGVVPEAPVTRKEFEEVRKFVAKLQLNQDKTVTWNGDVA